jgi:stage II sporulation protein P
MGMSKNWARILTAIGITVFACILMTVDDIPEIKGLTIMGREVIYAGDMCILDGQGVNPMVAEFLGGQLYWKEDEEEKQQLVLAENSSNRDEEESADEMDAPAGVVSAGSVAAESSAVQQENAVSGKIAVRKQNAVVERLKSTLDTEYLWKQFYIVDSTTSVTKKLFPVKELLERDMTIKNKKGKKQILIYHTHGASEYFSDSKSGKIEDSVVGVGDELTKELEKLGYGVLHDRKQYDLINGSLERSLAYNKSLSAIEKHLAENPDIKVIIDLHRDSVGKGKHTYTTIDGKKTAIVMFFNGMSRTRSGPIAYLNNPNLQGNLAFSLQLKCKAMEYYDGFTKPIYLKGYRYNLHLRERSLLIELGNENNTVEEVKNAAAPLADVLHKVLSGEG